MRRDRYVQLSFADVLEASVQEDAALDRRGEELPTTKQEPAKGRVDYDAATREVTNGNTEK